LFLSLSFAQIEDPHAASDEDDLFEAVPGVRTGDWVPDVRNGVLTGESFVRRNFESDFLPVKYIPAIASDGSDYEAMPENYVELIKGHAEVLQRAVRRITGRPGVVVSPVIEDVMTIDRPNVAGISEVHDVYAAAYGCDRPSEQLHFENATFYGCIFLPSFVFSNVAYLGTGLAVANIKKTGTVLHEELHAMFYGAHDRCYDMVSGHAPEYGNRYSGLGRPTDRSVVADAQPIPALSTMLQNQLLLPGQLVDVSTDGQQVRLGAFDVMGTRSDPTTVLGARISPDVDDPYFYLLVSFRALIDVYTTQMATVDAKTVAPAGGVVITGHHRLRGVGYSNGGSVVDTTPGSVKTSFYSGPTDCEDGAMQIGQQFYLSNLDMMIEVDDISRVSFVPGTRKQEYNDYWERVRALDQLQSDRAFATVTFYRISGLAARRAATCGNGVRDPSEQCDGGAGCTAECQCAPGYQIILGPTRSPACRPICGNGEKDFGEECDASAGGSSGENCDAATCTCVAGTGTNSRGYDTGLPRWNLKACYDGTDTKETTCGNGERDPIEVCDGTAGCLDTCQCGTRPGITVSGLDDDTDLTRRGGGLSVRPSLFKVTGECVSWFDHQPVSWASTFRGTYGSNSNIRAQSGDEDTSISLGVILLVAGGTLVACCSLLTLVALLVVKASRTRSTKTSAVALGAHTRTRRNSVTHRSRRGTTSVPRHL
jgi:hypothetical protein